MRFKEPENDSAEIWWHECKHRTKLMHGDYSVGETSFVVTAWQAKPYWYEMSQIFETEEEAKAWLATMYRLK